LVRLSFDWDLSKTNNGFTMSIWDMKIRYRNCCHSLYEDNRDTFQFRLGV
jgi:hypothetical protein